MIFNEAAFYIEADVFVEMAGGVVWFGSENRADLENALEDPYHDLFIELRALSQECGLAKVVQLECVGPAFGSGGDDFGGLDLGEAAAS